MLMGELDLVPVGYFVLDESGRISKVNDLGADLVAETAEKLHGRYFVDLVGETDSWEFLEHLRSVSASDSRRMIRVELMRSDSSVLAHLFTRPQKNEDGQVVAYHVAVVTVAAELIQAKEEAVQMSQLKTAFLANMSHEIRTPLTGIIGFATVLAKELPDEQREFAELIKESGRRLLEMLNSVLDLAKLESNQMSLETRPIRLAGEIRKVVDLLTSMAADKNLTLDVQIEDEGDTTFLTDRAALNRILHNLIGNAIKFTDEGGVTVRIWTDESHLGFDVSDTGIGIDADFLPRLFEEFSQESSGTDRSHSGTGLGLAITKRLVDLLNGEISVESRKDEGTTFKVEFPRKAGATYSETSNAAAQEAFAAPESSNGESSLRLLLVEDHTDTQDLLVELLEELYDVNVVGNASEALLVAMHQQFDMILMDINLGEGPDGIQLLKQLRRTPEYAEIPIVAVTAYALPGDKERFLDLGFTAYVSKPFDVDELLQLPMQLS